MPTEHEHIHCNGGLYTQLTLVLMTNLVQSVLLAQLLSRWSMVYFSNSELSPLLSSTDCI